MILGSLLAGGLGLLGSAVSSGVNARNVKKTNEANMELAKYQNEWQTRENEKAFERSVSMWNMQNQYNTPTEQMARLKAAGLNPNLVYGNGTVTGNTTSNAPNYEPARIQRANLAPYTGFNLGVGEAISLSMQDMANKAAVGKLNAETVSENLRAADIAARTARTRFDLSLAEELRNNTLEQANANLNRTAAATSVDRQRFLNMQAEFDKIIKDSRLSESQRQKVEAETRLLFQTHDFRNWENGMKKLGIYPSDSIYIRLATTLLRHLGFDPFNNN